MVTWVTTRTVTSRGMTVPETTFETGFEQLRIHVLNELDRIIAEIAVPMNTGLIPTSIAQELKLVVEAWPRVNFHFPVKRTSS